MAAILTQTIEVDLVPGSISPVLYVSQGDYGTRSLVFNLYSNGQIYTIPSSVTSITFEGSTSRGYSFAIPCTFSVNGTSAIGSLTVDMTEDVGMDICQLVLNTASGRLGSANVFVDVEQSAIKPIVKYTSTYFTELAKSWAIGETGIRPDENTNNSKYWCQQNQTNIDSFSTRLSSDEVRITDHERRISNNTALISNHEGRIANNTNNINSLRHDLILAEEYPQERLNKSVSLVNYSVINNIGSFVVDNNENKLVGGIYLPVTDITGELSGYPADAALVGKTYPMVFKNTDLPVMYLNGEGIENLRTKADGEINNVDIIFPYKSITTTLKSIKVQGASSQSFPKKNYTIKFNSNVTLEPSWGDHKKYVIKADWVDFSHMRNEIGAKLWGQIRKTRVNEGASNNFLVNGNNDFLIDNSGNKLYGNSNPAMSIGLNYGAIDAYPICVVINDKYWGIYSLSIPKDDWMAGMDGTFDREAIVCAETHSSPTKFKSKVNAPNEDGEMTELNGSSDTVVYSIEYIKDSSDMEWVSTSINNLIDAAMGSYSTQQGYLNAISPYIDIDSAIDYFIFNCVINNMDGTDKNFLLDTWDGTKWYFAAYDMDGTFGNHWSGKSIYSPIGGCSFADFKSISRIMELLYLYDTSELKARYTNLRSNVLSDANLAYLVWNYAIKIPKSAYDYEVLRWPSRPGTKVNNYDQILRYFTLRCEELDKEIAAL